MKNLFFGDSITSGENNNNISYVDYLKNSLKIGVSGTTMGEYSIYPVDGYSLLSQIPRYTKEIKEAKNIFIEYGINDMMSIITGYVRPGNLTITFVKVMDYIRQLNPNAKIYFLSASKAIYPIAKAQKRYIEGKYLVNYYGDFMNPFEYCKSYNDFVDDVIRRDSDVKVIEMFTCEADFEEHIDENDDLHPDNEGYKIIANNIRKEVDCECLDA